MFYSKVVMKETQINIIFVTIIVIIVLFPGELQRKFVNNFTKKTP